MSEPKELTKEDAEIEQYLRARRVKTQHAWFMKNFIMPAYKDR